MALWTKEEIKGYQQVVDGSLSRLYEEAGIPADDPERRARYLAEELLGLTMLDHEVVMRKAKSEGRPAALNLLEEMAVAHST